MNYKLHRIKVTAAALVASICMLGAPAVYAQTNWGPVLRLNNPDQPNETNLKMADNDHTLMAVWTNNVITQNTRVATSTDNGLTWSDSRLVALPDRHENLISLGDGRWFIHSAYHYITSTDDGLTWSEPGDFLDQTYLRGIAGSPDGTLIRGEIKPDGTFSTVSIKRSTDLGATWQLAQDFPMSGIGAITYTGNGNWLLNVNSELYHSSDDGQSWSPLGTPAYPLASSDQGVLMAIRTEGTQSGNAYDAGNDTYTAKVYTRVSYDHGKTWQPEQLVHTQTEIYDDLIVDYYPKVQALWVKDEQWVLSIQYLLTSRSVPFDGNTLRNAKVVMAHTYDHGATFPFIETVPDDPTYPFVKGRGFLNYSTIGGNVVISWVAGDIIAYITGILPDAPPPVPPVDPPSPPVEPPPPPVAESPAPDFTGVWAPAQAKCKTNKRGETKCSLKATFAVGNCGDAKAEQKTIVRLFLSADNTLDQDDVELKAKKVKKLKPGTGKSAKVKLKKLSAPVTGQHLIAVVDADGSVLELNESNNIIVSDPLP